MPGRCCSGLLLLLEGRGPAGLRAGEAAGCWRSDWLGLRRVMAARLAGLALALGWSAVTAQQDYTACSSHGDCPSDSYCDTHSMWCASQQLQSVLSHCRTAWVLF